MAYDSASSPDPLASDYAADFLPSSPSKFDRSSTDIVVKQCAGSTSCHRTKAADKSPSKIMTEQVLSPWRIRVTVEAEPDNEDQTAKSKRGRTRSGVHTVNVPLQDEEASFSTQPRKSSPARVKKSKRRSVTNLDALVLGDDAEEDEWCVKPKSPRKKIGSKTKMRRNSKSKVETDEHGTFDILEDTEAHDAVRGKDKMPVKEDSPELKQIDLNQVALRARKNSVTTKEGGEDKQEGTDNTRKVFVNSTQSYPTPSPTASETGDMDQNIPADVPIEQEVGIQTIMESEGFTMIDLDSLSAIKNLRSSPQDTHDTCVGSELQESTTKRNGSGDTSDIERNKLSTHLSMVSTDNTEITSHLASSPPCQSNSASAKIYSIGHLQLPSSLRIHRHRHVTPLPQGSQAIRSSPPPLPRVTPVVKSSTTNSKKAVEAGIALRDAVTPEPESEAGSNTPAKSQPDEEDMIFGGFSSGTRRELRADLRFGEELGTRQVGEKQSLGEKVLTPPANQNSSGAIADNKSIPSENSELSNQAHRDQRWQKERDEVVRQTVECGSDEVILIESDEDEHELDESLHEEETMGDIWLAEAKNASSSPKEVEPQHHRSEPRRKLIPSPWKRGEQIMDNASSALSGDESMSGLLWQMAKDDSDVHFGDDVLTHPDRYSSRTGTISNAERSTELPPVTSEDQKYRSESGLIEADVIEPGIRWRSAQDVVDEETEILEQGNWQTKPKNQQLGFQDESVTNLYETNLDALPEQDLLSPSQRSSLIQPKNGAGDHDSTYSSISDVGSITQQYKQRTSLSPSKDRPNTPRSAMKGGRASFGQALRFDGPEEEKKRVVWAKKAACVNELWEESSKSIRSTHDSSIDETPTPIAENEHAAAEDRIVNETTPIPQAAINLDGSPDASTNQDADYEGNEPYSRFAQDSPVYQHFAHVQEHQRLLVGQGQGPSLEVRQLDGSSPPGVQEIPSYLRPPSYPTIPDRDISQPLATAGDFSSTHFRTLHILYKKSQRPRFHAPRYPDEIRPMIRRLVEAHWRLVVDESQSMGEKFTFSIGVAHARVIERFMQEIEWDWKKSGFDDTEFYWGWSAEQLATWLGRIIVGEAVRADEKAAMVRE